MSQRDVRKSLHVDLVDPAELHQVLLSHYGHGSSDEAVSSFGPQGGPSAIRLVQDRRGRVRACSADASVSGVEEAQLRRKIEDHLLTPGPQRVGRRVLFAPLPTAGWFRFGNRFQIVPAPPEAPRPPYAVGPHPFLIEASFTSSSDMMISIARKERALREISLVVAGLVNLPIENRSGRSAMHWVARSDDPEHAVFLGQEFYSWPGAQFLVDDFSDVDDVEPIGRVGSQEYYARSGIHLDRTLELPASFEFLIEAYCNLDAPHRDRFVRSSYWLQHAHEVWTLSHSAAFVALVRSIEALMPDEQPQEPCDSCGRRKGAGATARFAEFVDRLAPDASVEPESRKRFYWTRSAVVHGGKLFERDLDHTGGMRPQGWAEYRELHELTMIVRIVLHNWLCERTALRAQEAAAAAV